MMTDSLYQHTLDAAFRAGLVDVRTRYPVDQIVEKFAWERVRKVCTPEKVGDPRFATEGPVFIRLALLEEILLCDQAKRGLRRRKKK